MSSEIASTYLDVSIDDIFGFAAAPTRYTRRAEKIEIEIGESSPTYFASSNAPVFVHAGLGSTAASGFFDFRQNKSEAITLFLSGEVPTQARAIIADMAQSSKALVEGYLNNLLTAGNSDRSDLFNSLVKMNEPSLVLNSALELFGRGKGERVLSFAASILESLPSKGTEAFKDAFRSKARGVELLISAFLNSDLPSSDKIEALLPLTESENKLVSILLIEELSDAANSVARPLLEQLTRSPYGEISELAKEALQEVA